jgi:hypothetical protein
MARVCYLGGIDHAYSTSYLRENSSMSESLVGERERAEAGGASRGPVRLGSPREPVTGHQSPSITKVAPT